jgi:hypothetical protein
MKTNFRNLLKPALILAVVMVSVFSCDNTTKYQLDTKIINSDSIYKSDSLKLRSAYEAGFKDALERLALLNLELDLKNERKTYGEMFEILYQRSGIKH